MPDDTKRIQVGDNEFFTVPADATPKEISGITNAVPTSDAAKAPKGARTWAEVKSLPPPPPPPAAPAPPPDVRPDLGARSGVPAAGRGTQFDPAQAYRGAEIATTPLAHPTGVDAIDNFTSPVGLASLAMGGYGIARAGLTEGVAGAGRAAVATGAPMLKYEAAKGVLQYFHVPPWLASVIAYRVAGGLGKSGAPAAAGEAAETGGMLSAEERAALTKQNYNAKQIADIEAQLKQEASGASAAKPTTSSAPRATQTTASTAPAGGAAQATGAAPTGDVALPGPPRIPITPEGMVKVQAKVSQGVPLERAVREYYQEQLAARNAAVEVAPAGPSTPAAASARPAPAARPASTTAATVPAAATETRLAMQRQVNETDEAWRARVKEVNARQASTSTAAQPESFKLDERHQALRDDLIAQGVPAGRANQVAANEQVKTTVQGFRAGASSTAAEETAPAATPAAPQQTTYKLDATHQALSDELEKAGVSPADANRRAGEQQVKNILKAQRTGAPAEETAPAATPAAPQQTTYKLDATHQALSDELEKAGVSPADANRRAGEQQVKNILKAQRTGAPAEETAPAATPATPQQTTYKLDATHQALSDELEKAGVSPADANRRAGEQQVKNILKPQRTGVPAETTAKPAATAAQPPESFKLDATHQALRDDLIAQGVPQGRANQVAANEQVQSIVRARRPAATAAKTAAAPATEPAASPAATTTEASEPATTTQEAPAGETAQTPSETIRRVHVAQNDNPSPVLAGRQKKAGEALSGLHDALGFGPDEMAAHTTNVNAKKLTQSMDTDTLIQGVAGFTKAEVAEVATDVKDHGWSTWDSVRKILARKVQAQ